MRLFHFLAALFSSYMNNMPHGVCGLCVISIHIIVPSGDGLLWAFTGSPQSGQCYFFLIVVHVRNFGYFNGAKAFFGERL
jgi:hypothetical protein